MAENEEEVLSSDNVQLFDDMIKFPNTLNSVYTGYITDLKENYAQTRFTASNDMTVDEEGLIFNSFIQIAANHAAILSINKEFLVTVGAKVNFLAPAKTGDIIDFEAKAFFSESKKREVKVIGMIDEIKVFEGTFYVVVLEEHIFTMQQKELEKQSKMQKINTEKTS